jgi:hypothetical protein
MNFDPGHIISSTESKANELMSLLGDGELDLDKVSKLLFMDVIGFSVACLEMGLNLL